MGPTTDEADVLIQLDDKRRVVLGKVGKPEHRRYLAQTFPDGTVLLKPAHIVTDVQLRYWANPEVMAQVEAAAAASEADPARVIRGRGLPPRRAAAQ